MLKREIGQLRRERSARGAPALVCLLLAFPANTAWSQSSAVSSQARNGALTDTGAPRPGPEFVLPPVLEPKDDAPISARSVVYARGFRIVGNTVLDEKVLTELVASYVDRYLTASELNALVRALTAEYVNAGYLTSGVVLPDQTVVDGVIELRVIEGRLTGIQLGQIGRFQPRYILSRIEQGDDQQRPLQVDELQVRLRALNQDPLIERVTGELAPGGSRARPCCGSTSERVNHPTA